MEHRPGEGYPSFGSEHQYDDPFSQGDPFAPGGKYAPGSNLGQGGQYGQNNPYGQGGQYGQNNPYGQGGQYGQNNPYGQGGQYGQNNPYGQGGQYGQSNPYGQGGQYGQNNPYGQGYGYNGQYGSQRGQYSSHHLPERHPRTFKVKKRFPVIAVLFFVIVAAIGGYMIWQNGSREAVLGIGEPVQTETEGYTDFDMDGYKVIITYKYEYDIEALVVHTKDYFGFGLQDKLSQKDLALAWGLPAAHNKDIDFHWDQSGRWYYFKLDSMAEAAKVGGVEVIAQQSSNNHIIPANDEVKSKVRMIRRGDHIRLKGYLVNVDAYKPEGERLQWYSSTTRTDTGDGACEVIYVTDVEWIQDE